MAPQFHVRDEWWEECRTGVLTMNMATGIHIKEIIGGGDLAHLGLSLPFSVHGCSVLFMSCGGSSWLSFVGCCLQHGTWIPCGRDEWWGVGMNIGRGVLTVTS